MLAKAAALLAAGANYGVWQTRSFRTQNTTLGASASAGATCVRLVNISGLAAGQTLRIDPNCAHPEVVTILSVGSTACNDAQGATITPALAYAHAAGALVTKNNVASSSTADPNDIAMSVMPAPTDGNPAPSFGAPVRIPIEADSGQLDDNALSERMYAPTCGLRIGSDNAARPATKPPLGRAPAPPLSLHRKAH